MNKLNRQKINIKKLLLFTFTRLKKCKIKSTTSCDCQKYLKMQIKTNKSGMRLRRAKQSKKNKTTNAKSMTIQNKTGNERRTD